MEYKGYQLMARVHRSLSDLFDLNEDGTITQPENGDTETALLQGHFPMSLDDDMTVLWYEHDQMHLPMNYDHVSKGEDGEAVLGGWTSVETMKQAIDAYELEQQTERLPLEPAEETE